MASAHPTTTTVAPSTTTSSTKLASTVSGTVDTKVGAVSMVTARTQSSPCSASRRGVTAATTTTLAHNDVRLSAPPKKKALAFQSLKPRRSSKRLLQHRSSRRMRAPDSPSLTQKHQHQQPPSAGPKAACAAAVTAADATPSPATPPAQQRKARSTGDRRQRLSLDSATLSGGSTSSAGAAGGRGRRLTTPDRHITLGPVIQAGAHGQVCFGFRRHNASPRRATVPNGRGRSRGRDHGRGAGPDAGAIAAAAVAAHNDGTASSGAVTTTTTKSTKSTKSTVAVKIGHGFNPESSQRTQWEALLLSSLLPRHPNLIAIPKGLGPSKCLFSGDVFLPLELADTDLLEFILKAPRFPAAAVRAMLHQLASVIAHLHANGVTHMDIKPDNVLLEFHTGDKDDDDATRGGVFSSPSATTSRSDASSEYSPVASPSATAAAVDKIANNSNSSSSATANPAIDSNLIHVPGVEPFRLILTDLGMAFRSTTEWPIKAAGVAGSACYAAPEVWTSSAGEDAARLIGLPAQPQAQAGAGAGAGAGTPPVLPSVASTSSESNDDGKQSSSEEEADNDNDNDNDNNRRGRRRSRRRRRASGERSPIVEPNVYNAVSADMWSLGAVLFTLMHRHPPWASATTNDPYYRGALETGWFDKRGMHEAPTPQNMDLEPKRPRGRGRSTVHMPPTTTTDPSPSPMRPEDGYASSSSSDSSNCATDAAPPADRDPVLHAVLHGLLRLRPEERWSATRVLAYLDSQQALTSSTAVPSHAGAAKPVVAPTPAPATTPSTVAVAPTPTPAAAPAPVVASLSLEGPLSARVPIAGRRAATPRPSPPATCRLPPAREPKLSAYRLQLAALRVDTPRVVIRF